MRGAAAGTGAAWPGAVCPEPCARSCSQFCSLSSRGAQKRPPMSGPRAPATRGCPALGQRPPAWGREAVPGACWPRPSRPQHDPGADRRFCLGCSPPGAGSLSRYGRGVAGPGSPQPGRSSPLPAAWPRSAAENRKPCTKHLGSWRRPAWCALCINGQRLGV